MRDEKTQIDILAPDSPLFTLEEQVKKLGIQVNWTKYFDDSTFFLKVAIKSGRETREIAIGEDEAEKYFGFDFTKYRGLGDLDAYEKLGSDPCIEVALRGSGPFSNRDFQRIPGWEVPEIDETEMGANWSVRFQGSRGEKWCAEIGPSSKEYQLLSSGFGRAATLKIKGVQNSTHDQALEFLEGVGNSILFELDMNYGMPLTMRRMRSAPPWRGRRRQVHSEAAPVLPRLRYGKEPLSLYSYARSAIGMPLLQFLAYYQVLEYYFPRYSQRDLLDRLRNELRDPRFRADDDLHLSRILRISQRSGRGYGDERSQLKSTVRYSTSDEAIAEFLEGNLGLLEYFSRKKPTIPGLLPVSPEKKDELINSVCDRIYKIRCLVVHAKEDGGGSADTLLLPFSREAETIRAENELMNFLAQKVLIAGAEPLPV